jgi:hypothetical protein
VLGGKPHQMHSLRAFCDFLLPAGAAGVAFALAAAATLALAARTWCSRAPLDLRFALLLLATALASPHLYLYDLVILAPAWLLLADRVAARPALPGQAGLRAALWAGFALLALGPLSRVTHLQLSVPLLAWLAWRCAALARAEAGVRVDSDCVAAGETPTGALRGPIESQLGR